MATLDLERGVLRTAEQDIADDDEEEVAERRVEALDQAAPALVAAAGASRHLPAVVAEAMHVFTCTRARQSPNSETKSL